ncbi:response regulator [Minicystis rosea]|nr:response regulator [Minicystis rosea]
MPYVLVVDDDDDIRQCLREVLADEGYRVETAVHGRQALDVLERGERPCLMLLDLMMPVMDGTELLAHVRADPDLAEIPVVIVSAANGPMPSDGVRVLRKPVALDDVLHEVERFCQPCIVPPPPS